jgi:hypothetical protein
VRDYRELEDGEGYPRLRDVDRMCKLYGSPQTLVGT